MIHVIIWITTIMLTISGLDDLYIDLMYWVLKRRHKDKLPDFSEMYDKPEKPIAITFGAWNESGVIGRTLSFAVRNLKYKNYRIFVGVYPNDQKTIDVVSKISSHDRRIKMVINPQDGPTTKADNLNVLYAAITDFEKKFGEFEILLVHDAEDFIHPRSLKLYNFLIGYKGYHGIQIPVVPIKSRLGNIIHRTYCDAFAEMHTKDMIVRQEMGTFMPFSGTGMGFHRKSMYCIEMNNKKLLALKNDETDIETKNKVYYDPFGRIIMLNEEYFKNDEGKTPSIEYYNNTKYTDHPFVNYKKKQFVLSNSNSRAIKSYTAAFAAVVIICALIFLYKVNSAKVQVTELKTIKSISYIDDNPFELNSDSFSNISVPEWNQVMKVIKLKNKVKKIIPVINKGSVKQKIAVNSVTPADRNNKSTDNTNNMNRQNLKN